MNTTRAAEVKIVRLCPSKQKLCAHQRHGMVWCDLNKRRVPVCARCGVLLYQDQAAVSECVGNAHVSRR